MQSKTQVPFTSAIEMGGKTHSGQGGSSAVFMPPSVIGGKNVRVDSAAAPWLAPAAAPTPSSECLVVPHLPR